MKYSWLFLLFFLTACASLPHEHLQSLVGMTSKQIQSKYGKPTIQRMEGDVQLWSYYQRGYSTLIFIDKDGIVQYAEKSGS